MGQLDRLAVDTRKEDRKWDQPLKHEFTASISSVLVI